MAKTVAGTLPRMNSEPAKVLMVPVNEGLLPMSHNVRPPVLFSAPVPANAPVNVASTVLEMLSEVVLLKKFTNPAPNRLRMLSCGGVSPGKGNSSMAAVGPRVKSASRLNCPLRNERSVALGAPGALLPTRALPGTELRLTRPPSSTPSLTVVIPA